LQQEFISCRHLQRFCASLQAGSVANRRIWTSDNAQTDNVLLQVLKGRLSVHQPTIMCDGFVYEEGEDLDEEELEANAANLPKTLHSLPGVHCQICIARCASPFQQTSSCFPS
jgi:hypothetical protein